jgi:hypothetical protein
MALAEALNGVERPVLRVAGDGEPVCPDCFGTLVVEDDGSISGTRGALVDCMCVELSTPPGFVECHECAALIRVTSELARLQEQLVREYAAFCATAGMAPAWCAACGVYFPMAADGTRPPCGLCNERSTPARVVHYLGSTEVVGPWGVER